MASRRQQYLDTYARAQASIERQKQIRADIADEQAQIRYLDSLLASERQTLAAIEQNFRVAPPQSLDQAVTLLKEQYASEDAQRRRQAADAFAAEQATTVTAEDRTLLTPKGAVESEEGKQSRVAVLNNAEKIISNPNTTPERAQAVFAFAVQQVGKDAPGVANLQSALSGKGAPASRKAAPGVPAQTPEERARAAATEEAFRTAFFAGPSGIVGGYEGMAVADARKTTLAPKGTSFNTAEDAYNAAIAGMGDGALSADEFATAEDFAYAKEVYAEAQAKKAYRNDERIHFEPSVLEARLRLKTLREQRDAARGASYTDPAREAVKRELMARGVKVFDEDSKDAWRNQYAQYQGTPYYDVYIQAHEAVDRWLDEGGTKRLAPVSKAQQTAVQYAAMLDAAKRPYSPATIMDELGRAGFSDAEAAEATSFLMAYKEIGGPKQGKTTYDALKAAEQKVKAEDERKKLMAEEAEAYFNEGVKQLENAERRILEGAPADYATDYRRLVEAGVPPAKAREMVNTRINAAKAGVKGQEPGKPYEGVPKPAPKPSEGPVVELPPSRLDLTGEVMEATPEEAEAEVGAKTFTDPTDPNSPVYTNTGFGYSFTDKAGKTVEVPLNTIPGVALALAEQGKVEELKRLQARQAEKKAKAAAEKKAAETATTPATTAPATAPAVNTTDDYIRDPETKKLIKNPNKK